MARSPSFDSGRGLDVHARTTIIDGSWSLVSNAAVRIGDDIFEVANDGQHYLNGLSGVELPTMIANRYSVVKTEENVESAGEGEDGNPVSFIRTWYTIEINNNEKIQITNFKTMMSVNVDVELSDTVGMLGSSTQPGLIGRDGTTINLPMM